jgi:hypothetical protein
MARSRTGVVFRGAFAVSSAVALVGFIRTAIAEDRPCMPGGVCCTAVGQGPGGRSDNRCGTLEEFQRYAKIVCLKADTIENKSLPEGIEAWGRCTAANMAAAKVEATQRANAEAHQRAMDARRQLREMGVDPAPSGPTMAQSLNFDGQWVADVPVQGNCPVAHITLFVNGSNVVGSVVNYAGTFPISGQIDSSGNGNISIVGVGGGRIKFSGDRVAADYLVPCGERRALGRRLKSGEPN